MTLFHRVVSHVYKCGVGKVVVRSKHRGSKNAFIVRSKRYKSSSLLRGYYHGNGINYRKGFKTQARNTSTAASATDSSTFLFANLTTHLVFVYKNGVTPDTPIKMAVTSDPTRYRASKHVFGYGASGVHEVTDPNQPIQFQVVTRVTSKKKKNKSSFEPICTFEFDPALNTELTAVRHFKAKHLRAQKYYDIHGKKITDFPTDQDIELEENEDSEQDIELPTPFTKIELLEKGYYYNIRRLKSKTFQFELTYDKESSIVQSMESNQNADMVVPLSKASKKRPKTLRPWKSEQKKQIVKQWAKDHSEDEQILQTMWDEFGMEEEPELQQEPSKSPYVSRIKRDRSGSTTL